MLIKNIQPRPLSRSPLSLHAYMNEDLRVCTLNGPTIGRTIIGIVASRHELAQPWPVAPWHNGHQPKAHPY
jgi:hypothetical protein